MSDAVPSQAPATVKEPMPTETPAPAAGPADVDSAWDVGAAAWTDDDPLLASLVAMTRIYERPFSADSLTAGLPLVDSRLTPSLFVRAAERAALSARVVKRRLSGISDLVLPCVLLLADRQACVMLAREERDQVRVLLPESGDGERLVEVKELQRRYTGYAIFVQQTHRYDARSEAFDTARPKSWFWGTLRQFWLSYLQVVIAAGLVNVFALVTPLFIMNVYDRVVPNRAIETLWVLATGAAIVFLFDFLMRTLRGYFIDVAGRGADVLLASRIFEQVLNIQMAVRPPSAGAFANNLKEFESLREFFTSATIVALVDVPFVILFVVVIWSIGGPVAWILIGAIPIIMAVGLLLQLPLDAVVRRTFREAAQKHAILVETLGGLETIKSLGAEGRTQRNYEQVVGLTAQSSLKARLLASTAVNFAAMTQSFVTIGVVVYGVALIAAGQLTVGALVACTMLSARALSPLAQIAGLLTRYHQSMASLDALDRVMAMPVEREAGARFVHRPVVNGEIELRNVSFSYPGQEPQALHDVSFTITPGERVGIIGRIGSGKSTVEKLILGLYAPDQGAILVDGTDIRQLDPADLRRNIGFVSQDIFLFFGSVRDNIAYGAPHADDAAILRAAEIAGVDEFARTHPSGLDMAVGERGEGLSGGQRQAVAIARALLLDPPVVMLDEPTSSMDNATEQGFRQRLTETLEGKTLVLVTHRSSLLSLIDRLIVLDGGRVVADGPKEKVLAALSHGRGNAGQERG